MILLIGGTLLIGAIAGFAISSEGAFFWGLAGQIVQELLCTAGFALVGVTFWRFGWKLGLLDLVLLFLASNVGVSFYRYLRKRADL
jgi:hypothetical protein